MSVFLDTNVLLYATLRSEDHARKFKARELLRCDNVVLSVQVLSEFVVQATRASRANRMPAELAIQHVENWRRFPIQETTTGLLDLTLRVFRRDKLAFWDSMIVAAALAQGCDILYTEDMQDGRIIDRLRIVNPFD